MENPIRTNVYIDGFNLYYGATKDTPYKWLDLLQLCQRLLPHDYINEIKYFTATVKGRPHDPSQPIRQQAYLRALQTIPNLTVIYGHFLTHPASMVLTGSNPRKWVKVDKTEEKGSDVNLASHLLLDAFTGGFEVAVLVTNDSDLAEPVRMVRQVQKLPVGILNPHNHQSVELKQHATFVKWIKKSHLKNSQFPPNMEDSKGKFYKPPQW
ncbi:MAG: NYN domain-containing protein [Nitrospirales bacterium]